MGLSKSLNLIALAIIASCFFSCRKIEGLVSKQSPREDYLHSLEKAKLINQEPVAQWIQNFNHALGNPTSVEIPYSEQIIYPVGDTRADAYLVEIPAGRKVVVEIRKNEGRGKMFVEARALEDKEKLIASMDSLTMQIEAEDELQRLILILQPELMAYGKWDLMVSHHPTLSFPVEGKDDSSVGSVFGDPRDGGRREHHGIDIFAAKGTPVLAVEDGWIYRTGQNNLGGNVVWLNSSVGSVYYAHLDSIAVSAPKNVKIGDTLGFVGNTGNAKYTPPHLHFGIYNNGPIDPFPYVKSADFPNKIIGFEFPTAKLNISSTSNFRASPYLNSRVIKQLEKGSEIWAMGKIGEWIRIWTKDGVGFVHSSLVEAAKTGDLNVGFHP